MASPPHGNHRSPLARSSQHARRCRPCRPRLDPSSPISPLLRKYLAGTLRLVSLTPSPARLSRPRGPHDKRKPVATHGCRTLGWLKALPPYALNRPRQLVPCRRRRHPRMPPSKRKPRPHATNNPHRDAFIPRTERTATPRQHPPLLPLPPTLARHRRCLGHPPRTPTLPLHRNMAYGHCQRHRRIRQPKRRPSQNLRHP